MSEEQGAAEAGGRHPRVTAEFFGHREAEAAFLDAYKSGRVPHAWLIGGPRGIGKATLAYRIARFVLANPDPAATRSAASLALPPDHTIARRMAAQGLPDLLALERVVGDKGKLKATIAVDQVRALVPFFGSTAGEGGWRVAIVDAVDDLNEEGENALLKLLEEPPSRALLLLVTHTPGRVRTTIRSRCRRLMLRPLGADDVARTLQATDLANDISADDIREAAAAAEGSVGRAIELLDRDTLRFRTRLLALLDRLPQLDANELHAVGDVLAMADQSSFDGFIDTLNGWMASRLDAKADAGQLARIAEAWDKVNRSVAETRAYNLDRRPAIFSAFHALADATAR